MFVIINLKLKKAITKFWFQKHGGVDLLIYRFVDICVQSKGVRISTISLCP